MKNWIYLFLGVATALIVTACGKSSGSKSSSTVGTCSAGYVYSSTYGCLPQSSCQAGYGLYNNQCVPATTNQCAAGQVYSSTYGCLTQGSCQAGYGLYNNQCVYADGYYNNGYNNGYNNNGYNYGNGYYYNNGYFYYGNSGYNPYMPYQYGYQYQRSCYWWYGQMMCQ